MKTNLVDLISQVSQLEKDYSELKYRLINHSMNTRIIELNGDSQMLDEYLDFNDDFRKFFEIEKEITKLKGIIFEKNNSLKLNNGYTIQQALVDIKNKRTALDLIEYLANQTPYKKRTSETNNSYFTSKELNYDKNTMISLREDLRNQIQQMELEISQLNSEMFDIN